MKGTELEVYDKTKEYKEEIAPLIKELVRACNINRIPMFVCCAPKNTMDKTAFETHFLSPAQFSLSVHENYFSDFVNIINGLCTTYYQAPGDKGANEEYEDLVRLMKEGEERIQRKTGDDNEGEDIGDE